MWIIRWVFAALFIVFIIGFAIQNTQQQVTVSFLHWQSKEVHLWVVMYLAYAAGIFSWLIISIFHAISLRAENTLIKKDGNKLREELNRLRNLSVEESIASMGLKELEPKDKEV